MRFKSSRSAWGIVRLGQQECAATPVLTSVDSLVFSVAIPDSIASQAHQVISI
jgi:hypothetical protein